MTFRLIALSKMAGLVKQGVAWTRGEQAAESLDACGALARSFRGALGETLARPSEEVLGAGA